MPGWSRINPRRLRILVPGWSRKCPLGASLVVSVMAFIGPGPLILALVGAGLIFAI